MPYHWHVPRIREPWPKPFWKPVPHPKVVYDKSAETRSKPPPPKPAMVTCMVKPVIAGARKTRINLPAVDRVHGWVKTGFFIDQREKPLFCLAH